MERLTKRQFLKSLALVTGAMAATPLAVACGSAPTSPTEAPKAAATSAPAASQAASGQPTPAPAAKPAASKEQVEIHLHMRSGGDKSEPAIYVDRPNEWSQETGYKLVLDPIPGGKDYIPKIDSMVAGGTIGDALWTSDVYGEHTHLVNYNVIEPVENYLGPHNVKKTEWFQSIVDTLTVNGKMYGLPKCGHPGDSYVWINLKMLDAAGIKKPDVYGVTFDQITDWATKLTKGPKQAREVYGYSASISILQAQTNGIRQFGGDLVNADGTTSTVDTPEAMDWLKWHYNLITTQAVHPLGDAVPTAGLPALFAAERLAMFHAQRSSHFQVKNAVQDKFPWMEIQFPRGPKAKGWGVSIDTHSGTATSKHKDETFTLLYALADQRFAYLVAKTQGYLTGRVDNLDAIKELASDSFLQLQQKCTEQSEKFWRAKNLRMYEFETALTNQLQLLWLNKAPLDAAYQRDLKKTLDDVLAKPA